MDSPPKPWPDEPDADLRSLAARAGGPGEAQLAEALRLDQARRWRRGDCPPVEAYLAWVPSLREREQILIDLISNELILRLERRDTPTHEEYIRRFPHLAAKLKLLFNLHEVFDQRTAPFHGPPGAVPGATGSAVETTAAGADCDLIDAIALPVRLGRYQLVDQVGVGGFGVVYRGWDLELQREVAVKVPHRNRVELPEEVDAFRAEARVLARLDHPGIVPVFDVGRSSDGLCYLVSKFIHGRSLAERLLTGRPAVSEAAALVAAVAEALQHAHERGLTHRDVKPGNILLDEVGRPVVVDFGLALWADDVGVSKQTFAGTPAYMSPEQARGEGHLVDARTDVYSLGVVLYELLTGQRPFRAQSQTELLEQVRLGNPTPPRQVAPAVPRELERVCLKALGKRASDRYATAQEFAEDLRQWFAGAEGGGRRAEGGGSAAPPSWLSAQSSQLSALGPVVPRGLHAFGEEDADFFLSLVPGPRGRDGLPEGLRFWKARLEARDPQRTFRTGVLYGPSGCGKSSLVRAGLLPRLGAGVLPVLVEAAPDDTEARLLRALRQRCPELADEAHLVGAVMRLRRDRGPAAGRKVVIVLDQFEQWLHARPEDAAGELVRAVRQCDGANVQCLLMVRDDFWMSLVRFLREVEVPLREGQNAAAVDLFDQKHARAVLAAFGRSFDALPVDGPPAPEQERFLDRAVEGLARDGRVIPVRLSLFAEMVKCKPWAPATLREAGGLEGVGVRFLEGAFGPAAPPGQRGHERAARAVLKALLPEPGAAIRGRVLSHSKLLEASGYGNRPADFDDLLNTLDKTLRLITPAERSEECEAGYQLTHDYLVDSLRRWLTARQRDTLRGRVELQLSEQAALWDARPLPRSLPSLPEWLGAWFLTKPRHWTAVQRRMMRAATRRHLVRLSGVLAAVVVLALLAGLWRDAVVTRTTVHRLLEADTADVPRILEELRGQRGYAERLLAAAADDPGLPAKQRLHANLALVAENPGRVDFLADAALRAGPEQLRVIADALRPFRGRLAEMYWRVVQDQQRPGGERLRAAALLADFAPDDPRWHDQAGSLAALLVAVSPLEAGRWQPLLRPARSWLIEPLESAFRSGEAGEAARSVAAALLADYAADDPARLVELLTSADRRSFPPLLAALRPHGEAAVERLSSVLSRGPEARWADGPVAAEGTPGRAVVAALETGGGLLGERFAFAVALPLADLDGRAEELARFGYRPCCLRPYAAPDGPRAAVAWVRDGRKWEWLHDATAEAVRARDAACRQRGLLPADVAWTAGGFAALWVEPTPDLAEAGLYIDVPETLHRKHWGQLNEREFVPRTDLLTFDGARQPRYTSVRWKLRRAPMRYLDTWSDDARTFAAKVARGFCQVDVRLVREPGRSEPRLGGAWWNGYGRESRVSPVLPVEGHLRWCRDQAAQGFRPVAVSAEGGAVVSLWQRPLPTEAEREAAARREALAAAALLHLGRPEPAWERLRLSPDPRVRGWLTHALGETGADPALLLDRLGAEADVSARRALLQALAEYPPAALDGNRVSALAAALFRTDPDPGVHSAAELLLRRLRPEDKAPAPAAPPHPDRNWFRNGEGQTFAVVRGPVKFQMGSPGDEPNRAAYDEQRRTVRIEYSFAVATTEVTVEQFLRYCRANNIALNIAYDYTPELTCPVTMITWHEAAAYCNWLSEREGLPACYEPDPDAKPTGPDAGKVRPMRPKKDYLTLTGYRLPTEAEWEFACRAGTATGRYYGFAEALLGRYAWTAANSGYRSWPVGRLLPNDLGLFDVLGNAMEFCDDVPRTAGKPDPSRRVIRGGAFLYEPSAARSAHRDTGPANGQPADRRPYQGFRLFRTLH